MTTMDKNDDAQRLTPDGSEELFEQWFGQEARSVAMGLLLQGGHEGRDAGLAAGDILLAVATRGRD